MLCLINHINILIGYWLLAAEAVESVDNMFLLSKSCVSTCSEAEGCPQDGTIHQPF